MKVEMIASSKYVAESPYVWLDYPMLSQSIFQQLQLFLFKEGNFMMSLVATFEESDL